MWNRIGSKCFTIINHILFYNKIYFDFVEKEKIDDCDIINQTLLFSIGINVIHSLKVQIKKCVPMKTRKND